MSQMNSGDLVRLKSDPGRQGTLSGKDRRIGANTYLMVHFPDGIDWINEELLEVVTGYEDIFDLFSQGKFGRQQDLRGSITHIRLNGRVANLIYSLDTTNTDFYPHQFKPVLNFLRSPSGNMLIADEVGLGKTIEAGLIWTELKSRFDYRRLMVMCPAMLCEKWKYELEEKFGISGEIVNKDGAIKALNKGRNLPLLDQAIIGSFQGLRPRKGWAQEEGGTNSLNSLAYYLRDNAENDPLVDLLVIDEAHYMRNPETVTADLGTLFHGVAAQVLLLSATPIHLRNRDLYQLMHMVDPDTFQRERDFEELLNANAPVVNLTHQILNHEISQTEFLDGVCRAQRHPLLSTSRQLQALSENPPTDDELGNVDRRVDLAGELDNINILGQVLTRTRKKDVIENRVIRQPFTQRVDLNQYEQEFYDNVTNLVREYAMEHWQFEAFLLVTPQRQMSSSMAAALKSWQDRATEFGPALYEDLGYDDDPQKIGPLVRRLLEASGDLGDLDNLWASDSKYIGLRDILTHYLKEDRYGKVILFSYFKPTLRYLDQRLREDGFKPTVLSGDTKTSKYEFIEHFRDSSAANILLSTEVASEGVDLQFSRFLVNYDLPWNPMRVEQRIGRIDRIGQRSPKISIWNLFYRDTIDDRIFTALYDRLNIFRYALGDFEAVLGEEIQKLTGDLIREKLTPEQERRRIAQTETAIANLHHQEQELEDNASQLIAHGEYVLRQVNAARDLNRTIRGEELLTYIRDFFVEHYPGSVFSPIHEGNHDLIDVTLAIPAIDDLQWFMRQENIGYNSKFSRASTTNIRCQFTNITGGRPPTRIERINQWHPIVRFVSNQIEKRIPSFYQVTALQLNHTADSHLIPGMYVFLVKLWSIAGIRSIDHIFYQAVDVNTGELIQGDLTERIVNKAAIVGSDLMLKPDELNLESWSELLEKCWENAESEYQKFVHRLEIENQDRAEIQTKNLLNYKNRQLASLHERHERSQREGKERWTKLIEGQIETLTRRMSQRMSEIEHKRKIDPSPRTVAAGIIKIV
ncbi:MAG: helicase [Candidatus Marinimicrobia bacterium]|nr:helicase [Candidatus Neomarinimicrobiota bacterium]